MGGKAFKEVTRRITKAEIDPTLTWLEEHWPSWKLNNQPSLYSCLLGSAGKNETSGDLDLNLEIDLYDQEKVAAELIDLLGPDYVKPRPGNNQIFTAIPIPGSDDYRVQVDFMFGKFEWQKFSYYSPYINPGYVPDRSHMGKILHKDLSRFKGLYRTELIKALVAYNSDWVLEENGEMIARVGPTFFHDRGVVWRYRYRPWRKDGKSRLKELQEVTEEEFMKNFPSAAKASRDVIDDPLELVHFLFDDKMPLHLCNTFERIWFSCRAFYEPNELKKITEIFYQRLNSLKAPILDDFGLVGMR